MQTQVQLSQKERMFLEDGKSQEEICVIKYRNYSNQAQDPQLKQLFSTISSQEQQHYDSLDQLLQGRQPNMNSQQPSQQPSQQTSQGQQATSQAMSSVGDKILCSDLLSTEKFVSGLYDTGVFEAANPVVRQVLQHIQQDEQRHGEQLFSYMCSNGMYKPQ